MSFKKLNFVFVGIFLLCSFIKAEFVVKSYQELKNERIVRQNYEQSCGAASLATLLNLVSLKRYSEAQILKLMSEDAFHTDMVSFVDLMRVLDKLGFENNAYQIDRQSLDKLLGIPMLVKIEDDPRFPHFVLIINDEGDFLQVLDPSFGEYLSSKRQFFSIWDKQGEGGFALMVFPQHYFEKTKLPLPKKLHFEFAPFKLF